MASFGLLNSVIWLVFSCILSVKFGEIFVLQLYSIGPIPCCKGIVCLSKQAQLLLFTITYCNKYLILTGTLLFFDNIKPGSLYRGRFDPNRALTTIGEEIWSGTSVSPDVGPRLSCSVRGIQIDLKPHDSSQTLHSRPNKVQMRLIFTWFQNLFRFLKS